MYTRNVNAIILTDTKKFSVSHSHRPTVSQPYTTSSIKHYPTRPGYIATNIREYQLNTTCHFLPATREKKTL